LAISKLPYTAITGVAVVLLIVFPVRTQAQSSPNDPDPTRWINYDQPYYKIPIAENGIYRLTATELQQAGVPVQQITPGTMQLFHRGVEQAIYVDGEADGHFDTGDFLEFYGQRNDGAPDSLLYRPYTAQPHPYYSLFNDTTAYFLTWQLNLPNRAVQPGKRMAAYTDTTSNLVPETYHWAEELRLFTDNYPGWAAGLPQKVEYSYYEAGEGYTGPIQQKDKPFAIPFQLTNAGRDGPKPAIDMLVVGRGFSNHRVDCLVGSILTGQRLLNSTRFVGYDNARIQHTVNWSDVGTDGRLAVSTVSDGEAAPTDDYSVSYSRVRYPQQLTANGQTQTVFRLESNPLGRSRLDVTDVVPGTRFWDISNPDAPIRVGTTTTQNVNTVRVVVRNTDTPCTLFSTSEFHKTPDIRPVSFANWHNRKPTYLIITHDLLLQSGRTSGTINAIQAYANYRASVAGGSHDTLTATMQQLFDQYSYGERHPLAIRRFARQMLRQRGDAVPYLLLIGRSRSTPGIRRNPLQAQLDMVMTAGFPGSDGPFTTGLSVTELDVPTLPTGRINAGTPEEVLDYLNKVKQYEGSSDDALWRKNVLHLSGGQSSGERDLFRGLVDSYQKQAVSPSLGARVTTFEKATDNLVESLPIAKPVNAGVGLITFFGHSGLDVTDLDIGFASSDALGYRNTGQYPLLFVNGCAIGNFFFGRPTLTTDWVLTPNRGAIAAIAQSHLGYTEVMHEYTTQFYTLLTDSTYLHQSIGQLQQETIRRVLAQTSGGRALANTQQMVLQGDPAIHLFPFRTPDYALLSGGITVQDTHNGPLTSLSDSVTIRAVVENAGQYRSGMLPVLVRRRVNGRESGLFDLTIPHTVAYRDTLTITFPNDRLADGQNLFDVTINPTGLPNSQTEANRTNNQATVEISVAPQQPVLVYPPDGGLVKTTSVRLVAQYFGDGNQSFDLELDSTNQFKSPFKQTQHLVAGNSISYLTTVPSRPDTPYFWRVRRADSAGGLAPWSMASFTYAPSSVLTGLPEGQLQLALASPLPASVEQGAVLHIPMAFTNLSSYAFGGDSLIVRQTIYAAGLSNPQTSQWRIPSPMPSDTVRFTTPIATEKLPGLNRLVLTVNPHLQPEYSYLNNTLNVPLFVQPDTFGPLLEVAFDGARITDGAVVSARPRIDILVADENHSLIRHDTTGLDLYLQRPGKNEPFERLSWQKATIPAIGADSAFRVRYPSPLLSEGLYHLLATARDAVGNRAVPYQVSFQVVASALIRLQVYPNPFHSQTLFAFTLTGNQPPDGVTISLTDLTGRVVRHLALPVRIGLNEWPWNGRSDSGALLPAGVYTYQLTTDNPAAWTGAADLTGRLSGRLILTR
jgi:hypothetical protein